MYIYIMYVFKHYLSRFSLHLQKTKRFNNPDKVLPEQSISGMEGIREFLIILDDLEVSCMFLKMSSTKLVQDHVRHEMGGGGEVGTG